ncbi:MAG: hypothetical protein B7Z29_14525 [Hyphomicrobium sp. 12-62-95]|nr:MAG: hypothetical protein B7Z29_14525 [Hyphomicrobium sp. 12-62-95]
MRAVFAAKSAAIFDHVFVVDCKAGGAKSGQEKMVEGNPASYGLHFQFHHQVIGNFYAGLARRRFDGQIGRCRRLLGGMGEGLLSPLLRRMLRWFMIWDDRRGGEGGYAFGLCDAF